MHKNFSIFKFPMLLLSPGDDGGAPPPEPTEDEKKAAEEKARQEEENKKYAERAERAARAERQRLLEELGVKDPDEAKKLLDAARKADEEKKSDLEREQTARQKAEAEAQQAREEAAKAKTEARDRVLNSEIKSIALLPAKDKDGKIVRQAFRSDALADVLRDIDRQAIKDASDGGFEGTEKALADLAKAKPWLLSEKAPEQPRKGTPPGPAQKRGANSNEEGERRPIVRSL